MDKIDEKIQKDEEENKGAIKNILAQVNYSLDEDTREPIINILYELHRLLFKEMALYATKLERERIEKIILGLKEDYINGILASSIKKIKPYDLALIDLEQILLTKDTE